MDVTGLTQEEIKIKVCEAYEIYKLIEKEYMKKDEDKKTKENKKKKKKKKNKN